MKRQQSMTTVVKKILFSECFKSLRRIIIQSKNLVLQSRWQLKKELVENIYFLNVSIFNSFICYNQLAQVNILELHGFSGEVRLLH